MEEIARGVSQICAAYRRGVPDSGDAPDSDDDSIEKEHVVKAITDHFGSIREDLFFRVVWADHEVHGDDATFSWQEFDDVYGCEQLKEYCEKVPELASLIESEDA